jgi:hypothetical protein
MKHLHSFDNFISESLYEINENSSSDVYFTIPWIRDNEKSKYKKINDVLNFAEKAIEALPDILERTNPGVFNVDDIGFELGPYNTQSVYVNKKKDMVPDYDKIKTDKEFKKYFEEAASNGYGFVNAPVAGKSKNFSSFFRLNKQ